MKIMQVNCVYKTGSTGKIMYELHKGILNHNIDSVVCYGRGQKNKEPFVYKTCSEINSKISNIWSRITGVMYGGCIYSTNKLIKIIKKENPDIVHLHCINGYFVNIYKLISWLKKNKFKTVLTNHAEFMYTANCGYSYECMKWVKGCNKCNRFKEVTRSFLLDNTKKSWEKLKKAFDGFEENMIVINVSNWLMDRAEKSSILSKMTHKVIYNGLDTATFKYYEKNNVLEELNIGEKKIIFHATPFFNLDINNIKGGYYVNEIAKMYEDVIFIVAGKYQKDANYSKNIIFLDKINNPVVLAKYYSVANLTLLTSKKETFSMVTAESLCCGTPIVGFMAGAPEQIAIKEYSFFVENGNIWKMKEAIDNCLMANFDKKKISKVSCEKYGNEKMIKEYLDIYNDMCRITSEYDGE